MISIDVNPCESLTCGGLQDFYKAARARRRKSFALHDLRSPLVAQKLDSFLDFRIHAQATLAAVLDLPKLLGAGNVVAVGIIHRASVHALFVDRLRLIREPHKEATRKREVAVPNHPPDIAGRLVGSIAPHAQVREAQHHIGPEFHIPRRVEIP